MSGSIGVSTSYEALLELEKSSHDSPSVHLQEAARIIGADVNTNCETSADITAIRVVAAPKEEWVLRWLMKKLKAPLGQTSSYRVEESSWILLRILTQRIPIRTLAMTLVESKFLSLLLETLNELKHLLSQPDVRPPVASKKRKRADNLATASTPDTGYSTSKSPINTLMCVTQAVDALVALVDRAPVYDAVIRSQVKLALRGEPSVVSGLLSKVFECAVNALQQIPDLELELSAFIDIWRFRRDSTNNDSESSNKFFASVVLRPALKILMMTSMSISDKSKSFVQGIERLVVLHVILPVRDVYFTTSQHPAKPNTDLNSSRAQIVSEELKTLIGGDVQEMSGLLPTFLDIAMRALPRDIFKNQVNEAMWLEVLFMSIAAMLGYSLAGNERPSSPTDVLSLEKLFQVVIYHKVAISLPVLMQYTIRFSGLREGYVTGMQWTIISQVIRIGPDVFIPNSGLAESKPLLDALVRQITLVCQQHGGSFSCSQQQLADDIMIPLLNSFFAARDSDAFLQIWIEQLKILNGARLNHPTLPISSPWEDDRFCNKFGTLISTNLSPSRIASLIHEIAKHLSHAEEPSEHFANLVVLDSILSAGQSQDGPFQGLIREEVVSLAVASISSNSAPDWRWRKWRVLQRLVHVFNMPGQNLYSSAISTANKIIKRFYQEMKGTPNTPECQEAYWSFQFIASLVAEYDDSVFEDYFNTLSLIIISVLRRARDASDLIWDSRAESLSTPEAVVFGCLNTCLRHTLEVLPTESRRQLLTFLSISVANIVAEANTKESFSALNGFHPMVELWLSLASRSFLLSSNHIVYDLVFVLCEQLTKSTPARHLFLQNLLSIPAKLIPRHQRGTLLDLLEELISELRPDPQEQLDILSLMAKLIKAPKSPARLANDKTTIWDLAKSVNVGESEEDIQLFHAFKLIYNSLVEKKLVTSGGKLGEYVNTVYNHVAGMKLESADFTTMEYYCSILSLEKLHVHQNELSDNERQKVALLRQDALAAVISCLKSLSHKLKKRPPTLSLKSLVGIFHVADTLQDLIVTSGEVSQILQKIDGRASTSDCDFDLKMNIKRQVLAHQPLGNESSKVLLDYSSSFSVKHLQSEHQQLSTYEMHLKLSSLPKDALVDFLKVTRASATSHEQYAYCLLLIGLAIRLLDPIDDRESPGSAEVSTTFTEVTDMLLLCTTVHSFTLATDCLDAILRTQARSVSQWNVDNILAKCAIVFSPAGPDILSENAGVVFTRISRLMGTLFGLYRKKLSGRFHLILPVLQRMLKCFFIVDSRPTKSSSVVATRPLWLGAGEATPLQPEHAAQFSRLLASLCDPTVFAVESHRGRQNHALTDNTKKVKSVVGQHLQYLVMEYCRSQLRGTLTPEIKAALMPGFYTVLDVMGKNIKMAMNIAMDSSAREIYKGLYDDYMRFGKWNHD